MKRFRRLVLFGLGLCGLWAGATVAVAQSDAPLNPGFDIDIMINPASCGLFGESFDPFYEGGGAPSVLRNSGLEYGSAKAAEKPFERMSHSAQLCYKNQLNGFFSSGCLRIISAAYQCRFFRERMALGAYLYSNTLDSRAMQDFEFFLNYAYHWTIREDGEGRPLHRLSFGLQAGYRNYGYNTRNMVTGSMYDPAYTGGFNPALGNLNELPDNRNMFDGHFGLQYSGLFISRVKVDAGAAIHHIFRPRTGLMEEDYRVPLRFSAFGRVLLALLNPKNELGGHIYYNYQAAGVSGAMESMVCGGISYRYKFQPGLSLGGAVYLRTQATVIPQFTLDISNLTLHLQVEINTAYSFNNLFAISLSYRL